MASLGVGHKLTSDFLEIMAKWPSGFNQSFLSQQVSAMAAVCRTILETAASGFTFILRSFQASAGTRNSHFAQDKHTEPSQQLSVHAGLGLARQTCTVSDLKGRWEAFLEESPVDEQHILTKSLFLFWMGGLKNISSCSPTLTQPAHFVTSLLIWSLKTICVSFPFPGYHFKNNLAESKVCSLSMPGTLGEVWWSRNGTPNCHKGFWGQSLGRQT